MMHGSFGMFSRPSSIWRSPTMYHSPNSRPRIQNCDTHLRECFGVASIHRIGSDGESNRVQVTTNASNNFERMYCIYFSSRSEYWVADHPHDHHSTPDPHRSSLTSSAPLALRPSNLGTACLTK